MPLVIMFVLTGVAGPIGATTLHVPSQYPTIQAGISAASPGDTVLVACGTYEETLIEMASGVCLLSETGQADCALIAAPGWIIECWSVSAAIIRGFTLVAQLGDGGIDCQDSELLLENCCLRQCDWRGGIRCEDSEVSIRGCEFIENHTIRSGAGVLGDNSILTIEDCAFWGNNAEYEGGGVAACCGGSATLTRCTFSENWSYGGSGLFSHYAETTVQNCTFYAQHSGEGCIYLTGDRPVVITNTIVAFSTHAAPAVRCEGNVDVTLSCCDLHGNAGGNWVGCIADQYGINGNINADPLFCDAPGGDLRLHCDSPCAAFTPPNPECDLIGVWPVGCGATGVNAVTWGGIKAMFRDQ